MPLFLSHPEGAYIRDAQLGWRQSPSRSAAGRVKGRRVYRVAYSPSIQNDLLHIGRARAGKEDPPAAVLVEPD